MTLKSSIYPVFIHGRNQAIAGHVFGRQQPSLMVSIKSGTQIDTNIISPWNAEFLEPLFKVLIDELGIDWQVIHEDSKINPWMAWISFIGEMAVKLLQSVGFPAVDPVKVLHFAAVGYEHERWSKLLLPVMPGRPSATVNAWQLALQTCEDLFKLDGDHISKATLLRGLEDLRTKLPKGTNTARFLNAAYEKKIPVLPLGMDIFQFGQGSQSQWFDSTATLQTSSIAVKLARNKQATAARLRQAGLPVPSHQRVTNFVDACSEAQKLGYPVVVKPLDRDGGKGVMAAIDNECELRTAFELAKSHSSSVLVEKHIFGRDYRLTVLDGKLLWAIERLPAGVTGDGVHNITRLVALENLNPHRGHGAHAILKNLVIDEDVELVLSKQGLSPESVPALGQFVVFKRIANVASGGFPVAVNHKVHPDNAQLAVQAAQALRLDVAGIDLLIPDIAISWRDGGAAICEVNAQPQLGATTGPHLYGQILEQRLGGQGRIPVFVVLGSNGADGLMPELISNLQACGLCVGWHDLQSTGVGNEDHADLSRNLFTSGQKLLTDQRVDVFVLAINDQALLNTGLPTDIIHGLVIAGQYTANPASNCSSEMRDDPKFLEQILPVLLPSTITPVYCLKHSGVEQPSLSGIFKHENELVVADKTEILLGLMAFLKTHDLSSIPKPVPLVPTKN